MKRLKTFEQFLNESKLPHEIEKVINQSRLDWEEDEDMTEELYDERGGDTEDAHVYVATDKSRGREYVFKGWLNDRQYNIQLEEDETVIFAEQYSGNEKKYYDRDCETILGFSF